MKIDYSKFSFTKEEQKFILNETETLRESNPNYIPVLIQLDSNILKMDKQKFLISHDINFNDFITNTLTKKMINLNKNDVLKVSIANSTKPSNLHSLNFDPRQIKYVYNEFKDNETQLLILRVSRNTTYKTIKKYVRNYFK